MAFPRPQLGHRFGTVDQPQPREVDCTYCGAKILRKTHYKHPSCAACTKLRTKKAAQGRWKVVNVQARRYRIMLHFLGYEDSQFGELLDEIKKSPMAFRTQPEGWAASYDMGQEMRARGLRLEAGRKRRAREAREEQAA